MITGITIGGLIKNKLDDTPNNSYNYFSYYTNLDGNNYWATKPINSSSLFSDNYTAMDHSIFKFCGCDDYETYKNSLSSLAPVNRDITIVTDYVKQHNRQIKISLKLEREMTGSGFFARSFLSSICGLEENRKIILHTDEYINIESQNEDEVEYRLYMAYEYLCSFLSCNLQYNSDDTYYTLTFDIIGENENINLECNKIPNSLYKNNITFRPFYTYKTEDFDDISSIDNLSNYYNMTKTETGWACLPIINSPNYIDLDYHGLGINNILKLGNNSKRSLLGNILTNMMNISNPSSSFVRTDVYNNGKYSNIGAFNFNNYIATFPASSYKGLISLYYGFDYENDHPIGERFVENIKTFIISIGNNFVIKCTPKNLINPLSQNVNNCRFNICIQYNIKNTDHPINVYMYKLDNTYERSGNKIPLYIEFFGNLNELIGGTKSIAVIAYSINAFEHHSSTLQDINYVSTHILNDKTMSTIWYANGGDV